MQNLFSATTLHAPGAGCAPCRPPRHDDPDGDIYGAPAPDPDPARPPPSSAPEAAPLVATVAVTPRQDPPPVASVATPRQDSPLVGIVVLPQQDSRGTTRFGVLSGADAPTAFAPGAIAAVLKEGQARRDAPASTSRLGPISGADAPTAFAPGAIAAVLKSVRARTSGIPPLSSAGLAPAGALSEREMFAGMRLDEQSAVAREIAPEAADGIIGLLVLGAVDEAYEILAAAAPTAPAGALAPQDDGDDGDHYGPSQWVLAAGCLTSLSGEANDPRPAGAVLSTMRPSDARAHLAAAAADVEEIVGLIERVNAQGVSVFGKSGLASWKRPFADTLTRWQRMNGEGALALRADGQSLADAVARTKGALDADTAARVRAQRDAASAVVANYRKGALSAAAMLAETARGPGRLGYARAAAERLTQFDSPQARAANALALHVLTPPGVHSNVYDATVARHQASMGEVAVDGYYGVLTRLRMLALGVGAPLGVGEAIASAGEVVTAAQRQAAQALVDYVRATPSLRGNVSDTTVARHQRAMGGITADGKYGLGTQGRIRAILGSGVAVPDAPTGPAPTAGASSGTGTAAQQAAARSLISYVNATPSLRSNVANDQVRAYQTAMGGVTADGKYGAGTQARIRALLGASTSVPAAPTGAAPAATTPAPTGASAAQRAAQELADYVRATPSLRGNVYNATVERLQRAIGGGVTIDGKYGAGTQARLRALGVDAPALAAGSSPTATTAPPATTAAPGGGGGGGGGGSVATQINEVLQGTAAIIAALNPQARTNTEADTRLTELRAELEALNARGASAERDAQLQRALDQLTDLRAQVTATAADAANRLPGTTPPPASLFSSEVGGVLVIGGAVVALGVLGIMGMLVYSTTRTASGFQGGPERIGAGRGQQAQFGYAA